MGYIQRDTCAILPKVKMSQHQKKCKILKRTIKDLIFENGALCDHLSQLQHKILVIKEERKVLLKKVHTVYGTSGENQSQSHSSKQNSGTSSGLGTGEGGTSTKKTPVKKKAPNEKSSKGNAKPKKTATPKVKKIVQQIPLDNTGRPVFPIILGGLTIHSLGEVVSDRSAYHTEEHIYPVGFCSTRVYGSLQDPEKKCMYTCKILDGGSAPSFEIVADSDLNIPLIGTSANECHALLLHHINHAVGIEVVNTLGRGPEFFGFSHPTIQNLIQSSPGTRKCTAYKWSKFEVSRTGETVVEENDASLSFEALQRSLAFSKNLVIKEEPTDHLLGNSSATLRDLLMS